MNINPKWAGRHKFRPGALVPLARAQALAAIARGGKRPHHMPYTPRDLSDDQIHDVERLLRVRGLKRKHIALMCGCSVRLINRYFPQAEYPYLPLPP